MDKIIIFDTTLRDGEQAAGGTLNIQEKLEIARQLESLGVDVIEAGFPAASPGDFDAVSAIAKHVRKPVICGLSHASATRWIRPPKQSRMRSTRGFTSSCRLRKSISCIN